MTADDLCTAAERALRQGLTQREFGQQLGLASSALLPPRLRAAGYQWAMRQQELAQLLWVEALAFARPDPALLPHLRAAFLSNRQMEVALAGHGSPNRTKLYQLARTLAAHGFTSDYFLLLG